MRLVLSNRRSVLLRTFLTLMFVVPLAGCGTFMEGASMHLSHEGRSLDSAAYIRTHKHDPLFSLQLTSDNFADIEHFSNRRDIELAWYFVEVPAGEVILSAQHRGFSGAAPANAQLATTLAPGGMYLIEIVEETPNSAALFVRQYGDKYTIVGTAETKSVERHYTGTRPSTFSNSQSVPLCNPCSK